MQCGLVRNPLGYLFKATNSSAKVQVLDDAPNIQEGHKLSSQIAAALGLGKGCDADDGLDSAAWNSTRVVAQSRSPETFN